MCIMHIWNKVMHVQMVLLSSNHFCAILRFQYQNSGINSIEIIRQQLETSWLNECIFN